MGATAVRRRDCLRAVIEAAADADDPIAPWRRVAEAADVFEDEADVLTELHREWVRLLSGRLHPEGVVVERTPVGVRDLYDETRTAHQTLRSILDTHHADPVLWEPTAREHAMIARAAGLAPEGALDENAAALGRSLVTQRLPVQRSAHRR